MSQAMWIAGGYYWKKNISGDYVQLIFSVDNNSLIIQKGSITINGVSLTVNSISENQCEVMIIPHTLERTNLNDLKINDAVNIEYDHFVKVIAKQVKELKLT